MGVIEDRRSIRKYTDEPVSDEMLTAVLEAGRQAPSPKNSQPWHFIVYRGGAKKAFEDAMERGIGEQQKSIVMPKKYKKGLRSALNTLKIIREAPVIVLVLNEQAGNPFMPVAAGGRIMEILQDLAIGACMQNMTLKATELGLGSLWVGNTFHAYGALEKAVEGLGKRQIAGAILLGHAAETPRNRSRKPLAELVEYRE